MCEEMAGDRSGEIFVEISVHCCVRGVGGEAEIAW